MGRKGVYFGAAKEKKTKILIMFKKLLHKQYQRFRERNWDTLYFLVDVHEVILKPDYEKMASEYYPLALKVLKMLSNREEVCLIMWTASSKGHRKKYLDKFRRDGINFRYVNENPEVLEITKWGDYESKMYANIGLDDKFSFDPTLHWEEIKEFYDEMESDENQLKFDF